MIYRFTLVALLTLLLGNVQAQNHLEPYKDELDWYQINEQYPITGTSFIKYIDSTGLGGYDTLIAWRDIVDEIHDNRIKKYHQYHKGYWVEGSDYYVHLDPDGYVEVGHGRVVDNLNVNIDATITESQALAAALAAIDASEYSWQNEVYRNEYFEETGDTTNYDTLMPHGQLLISMIDLANGMVNTNYALLWKFQIIATSPPGIYVVYVDGEENAVRIEDGATYNCGSAGTACVTYHGCSKPVTTYKCGACVNYRSIDNCTRGEKISSWGPNGFAITDGDNNWGATVNNHPIASLWAAEVTYDVFAQEFARLGTDNNNGRKLVILNDRITYSDNQMNAGWTNVGGKDRLEFGYDDEDDPWNHINIVSHEYIHGVTRNEISYAEPSNLEAKALNESFSDILAEYVEFIEFSGNDYVLADASNLTIDKRDLADPYSTAAEATGVDHAKYYNDANWQDREAEGNYHPLSTVQSHWFYLLAEGGEGINSIEVNGIGIEKAARIAYVMQAQFFQAGSNYPDMRNAAIAAAASMYGHCSDEVVAVTDAWAAVNVGSVFTNHCIGTTSKRFICYQSNGSVNNYVINTEHFPSNAFVVWDWPSSVTAYSDNSYNVGNTLHITNITPNTTSVTIKAYLVNSSGIIVVKDIVLFPYQCSGKTEETSPVAVSEREVGLVVAPNPTSSSVNIIFKSRMDNAVLKVYDNSGREVYTSNVDGLVHNIDMANLPSGIYYVRVQNDSYSISDKIVKQ